MLLGLDGRAEWVRRGMAACAALALAAGLSGCGGNVTVRATPQLSLSTNALSFPATNVGSTSAAETVTLTNSGNAPATISGVGTSGDFSGSSTCGASLAAGGTCQLSVVFSPGAVGARTGTLTVTSNGVGSPQTVALSGTGTVPGTPQLLVSPLTLAFGTIATGSLSAAQLVTLTNTGGGVLTISGIVISGDFTQTSSGCGVGLLANASCTIAVVFGPMATGAESGALSFTSNAGGAAMVALSGTGVAPVAYVGLPLTVTVRAGTQPVVGASVQLYAAGTRGNGSAGTQLGAAVTTSATGMAVLPGGYSCPGAGAPVYVVSRGGVVGAAGSNANIALMTAIGPCSGVVSGASFVVDEATTAGAAYGLAQFYALGAGGATGSVGATGGNLTGISNAFATAAELADPVLGTSPGATLPSTASSPAARVNSVANMLNACVVAAAKCAALYTATTPAGGAAPANTLDATFALARSPGSNVGSLFAQAQMSTAYAPALGSAPADWTMFFTESGGGLNSPSGIGVDSTGSVWVANYFYVASKFTPAAGPVFVNGIAGDGLNNSYGLAIDLSDNAWIPNEMPYTGQGVGTVSELAPSGASLAGNGYAAGGLNYPLSVAIDPNGTVWVVDFGNSHVTLLSATGAPLSGTSGYTTSNFAFPVAVAVDSNHFGWVVNQASDYVTKVAPDGSSFTNYLCCNYASGIAIDQGNNIWVANYFGDTVSLMTNSGTVIANNLTGGGSIYHPQGIALDGAGNVWVANYRAPYLTELAGANASVPGAALSPATGLGGDAGQLEAYALALDASGNVWVSNQGSNTITKYIGLATPVKTPLSALPKLP